MKIKKIGLLFISFIIIVSMILSGCAKQEKKNAEFMSSEIQQNNTLMSDEELTDLWFSVGEKYKEALSLPGIDDTVIMVNGLSITRKTIEYQKALQMLPTVKPLKDEIISIVRSKVVQSEAIKKGIEPSQEDIDEYLKQNTDALNNEISGTETILAYINGMGITVEEYMETQKDLAYSMFQRNALYLSLDESTQENYEQYIDELVEKAEIEIIDPEIQKLFD